MKKIINVLPLLTLLLLCGCNQKQEPGLKARVEKLEAQQKLTAWSFDELLTLTKAYQDQNQQMFNELKRVALSQSTNMDNGERLLLEHLTHAALHSWTNMDNVERLFLEHLTNAALHSWPNPEAAQKRGGVPLEVFYAIAGQAIKKWPSNYQKQEDYIRGEIERYKKLHP